MTYQLFLSIHSNRLKMLFGVDGVLRLREVVTGGNRFILNQLTKYNFIIYNTCYNSYSSSMNQNQHKHYAYLQNAAEHLEMITEWQHVKHLAPLENRKQGFVSFKSMAKLIVELSYLVYFISISKSTPYISNKILVTCSRGHDEELRLGVVSQKQVQQMQGGMKQLIRKVCIKLDKSEVNLLSILTNYIDRILWQFQRCIAQIVDRKIDLTTINKIYAKFYLIPFSKLYQETIKKNTDLIHNLHSLLLALEETELFRQNSLLLKYKNNSILCRLGAVWVLTNRYQGERSNLMKMMYWQNDISDIDQDGVRHIQKLEWLVQEYIKILVSHHLVKINFSINTQMSNTKVNPHSPKIIIGVKRKPFKQVDYSISIEQELLMVLDRSRLEQIITNNKTPLLAVDKKWGPQSNFQIGFDVISNKVEIKLISSHLLCPQDEQALTILISSLSILFEDITYSKCKDKKLTFTIKLTLSPRESPFITILQSIDKLKAFEIVTFYEIKYLLYSPLSIERKNRLKRQFQYLLTKIKQQIPTQLHGIKA